MKKSVIMYIRNKIKLYSRFNAEGALKMLKKGDVISYGTTGVCKVEGECEQTVKGQKKRYIVLKPVHQANSTLYVPLDNDELKTKFKPLLTVEEIEEIIKMPEESSLWKESSSERAELYSQILESGDRKRLAQLVRTLYLRQKHLIARGRHLHSLDERFFKNAENLLFDEFSAVLGISQDEVFDFIENRLSKA